MKEIWKEYILPDRADRQWYSRLFMSFVLPAVLFFLRPVGMDLRESAVTAGVVLAIIWWSSGIVKKIPAAVFLLLLFMLVSQTIRICLSPVGNVSHAGDYLSVQQGDLQCGNDRPDMQSAA